MSLIQKDQNYIWHPFTPQTSGYESVIIKSAKGVWLYTQEGEAIIDAISSWWVNLHGHAHQALNKALQEQSERLEHVIFAGFAHEPAICLAEQLLKNFGMYVGKVFFSDNGSTAVEVAIKIALQSFFNQDKPRLKLIAFEGAYHGDTFGSMAVGDRNAFNAPFFDLLFDVSFLPLPSDTNFDAVCSAMQAHLAQENVAAFIYEPLVQGAAGMRMYAPEHLETLMQMVHLAGGLCIADEVMTGFGRTGTLFASQQMRVQPDLVCLSKGLTGGYMPLGATLVQESVYKHFQNKPFLKTFFHGHSFTANPLACAVAKTSLDLLLEASTQANIDRITGQNKCFLEEIKQLKRVREVRTMGTILAIELENEQVTSYFNEERQDLYQYFLQKGVLLRPLGNVVYTMPPYCITENELQRVFDVIKAYISR